MPKETTQRARAAAREAGAAVREEATDRMEDLKEAASEQWQRARKIAGQKAQMVQEYAEDNPWQLAAIGAAVGFVMGALIFRRRD